MGIYLDDLIANPDRPHEAASITQMVWEGNAVHEFGKRRRKDGKLVDVEIFGEQIRINGNRIGVLGLYRDITAEKEAQEALSASEERFRIMFDDSPVSLRMEDYSEMKKWLDENFDKDVSLAEYVENHPDLFSYLAQLPRIIDLNDATLWMFGANDKSEMQHFLHDILSSECRREAAEIIDALRSGETSIEAELIYNRLDGKKIYTITKLSIIPGYEKNWGACPVFQHGYHRTQAGRRAPDLHQPARYHDRHLQPGFFRRRDVAPFQKPLLSHQYPGHGHG